MMNPALLVHTFVQAINAHSVERITEILSADHCFIDALDQRVSGRERMAGAWAAYFRLVPDYRIDVEQTLVFENAVALFGRAGGTCVTNAGASGTWEVPAAWRAEVWNDRITRWQIYADNEPIRQLLKADE